VWALENFRLRKSAQYLDAVSGRMIEVPFAEERYRLVQMMSAARRPSTIHSQSPDTITS
jgi:hypothetical protein